MDTELGIGLHHFIKWRTCLMLSGFKMRRSCLTYGERLGCQFIVIITTGIDVGVGGRNPPFTLINLPGATWFQEEKNLPDYGKRPELQIH